jgi:hypothetical protein
MGSMKKVDIFDEENSILIETEYDIANLRFYPKEKKFKLDRRFKDGTSSNTQIIEYKVSNDPVCLEMRILESFSEPPLEYEIKDGTVLESELEKGGRYRSDQIEKLKNETTWNEIFVLGNYQVNLYILSKHPEIISHDDFRKFVRQSIERIKTGIIKIEETLKEDKNGLEILTHDGLREVGYPSTNESVPEEGRMELIYNVNKDLFKKDSPKFVGITKHELSNSIQIIEYLEKLLES